MRARWIFIALAVLLVFSGAEGKSKHSKKSKKGRLSVNASVSVFDPPGDVSSALLFEVSAKYRLSDKFTSELSVGWSQYDDGGVATTFVPVEMNMEFHPLGQTFFDPYLGGGVSANVTQAGDEADIAAGVQALAGLSVKATNGVSFSVELKYRLPDISDPSSGGFSLGGGANINWSTEM